MRTQKKSLRLKKSCALARRIGGNRRKYLFAFATAPHMQKATRLGVASHARIAMIDIKMPKIVRVVRNNYVRTFLFGSTSAGMFKADA